jgi:hypothetical protein
MKKVLKVFVALLVVSGLEGSSLNLSFYKFMTILKQLEMTSDHFEVVVEKVVQLSDTSLADFTDLKVLIVPNARRTDRKPQIFGNVSVNQLLDDSYTVLVETFKKQDGEFQELYTSAEKRLCEHFSNENYYFEEFCASSGLDYPPPCPFESVS